VSSPSKQPAWLCGSTTCHGRVSCTCILASQRAATCYATNHIAALPNAVSLVHNHERRSPMIADSACSAVRPAALAPGSRGCSEVPCHHVPRVVRLRILKHHLLTRARTFGCAAVQDGHFVTAHPVGARGLLHRETGFGHDWTTARKSLNPASGLCRRVGSHQILEANPVVRRQRAPVSRRHLPS